MSDSEKRPEFSNVMESSLDRLWRRLTSKPIREWDDEVLDQGAAMFERLKKDKDDQALSLDNSDKNKADSR